MSRSARHGGNLLMRIALRSCEWSERWFPDAFSFAIVMLAVTAVAALGIGVRPGQIAHSFGNGFWSLITFTMQMCFVIIGGFVTADSPPVAAVTRRIARLPHSGRAAILMVAIVSMMLSLLHWALSVVFSSLLVRALGARPELRMDYRAAGAAAFVGIGSIWALGLSSSAAQLQANPAAMPPALLAITGVIPFSETIFTWQSAVLAALLSLVSAWVAWRTAPDEAVACTAIQLGVELDERRFPSIARTRPGDWLEYSPLPNLLLAALILAWLVGEVAAKGVAVAIASLNAFNLLFLMLGLLLQWRPRRFLDAVARSMPGLAGVLVQFPVYGGIAAILSGAANASGQTLSVLLARLFVQFTSTHTYAVIMGAYSAVLGLFVPSAGGKWLIEAPYVMQTANDLKYPLGWSVQIYNAAEALPNLINPFWMLPVLGVLGLRAREVIGYTFVQFIVHVPLVLVLLWLLGTTLSYHVPAVPMPPTP